jgi:hypothetical protein
MVTTDMPIRGFLFVLLFGLAGCSAKRTLEPRSNSKTSTQACSDYVHEHLARGSLYVRVGNDIVEAPARDLAVAKQYPTFPDKGPLQDGQRITIMTAKSTYRVGEEVRIIHVLEAPEAGHEIYVMGPKAIEDEFVDGKLASQERKHLAPYNGRVVQSPGIDFNYDVSTYKFVSPGVHTIQWKGGGHSSQGNLNLESNVLRIEITR